MTDTTPSNENERLRARIDAVWSELRGEDREVLGYIFDALTPQSIARRPEWDTNVRHLHEVARQRLKSYEKEAASA